MIHLEEPEEARVQWQQSLLSPFIIVHIASFLHIPGTHSNMAGYKLGILAWVLFLAAGFSLAASGATLKLAKARSGVLHGGNSLPRSQADCQPARYDFSSQATGFEHDWLPLDSPQSYALGSDGLSLFLDRPSGRITSKGNVNSKVAEGSTFNSTFTLKSVNLSRVPDLY